MQQVCLSACLCVCVSVRVCAGQTGKLCKTAVNRLHELSQGTTRVRWRYMWRHLVNTIKNGGDAGRLSLL